MKKKFFGLLILLLIVTGCSLFTKSKTFDEGNFKITLTDKFKKENLDNVTYYYENNYDNVGLTVLLETYETLSVIDLSRDTTLREYADIIVKQMPNSEIVDEGKYMYFTYSKNISNQDFFYMATMYKGDKGFYLLNFFCEEKNKDKYIEQFKDWAKTVEI